MPRPLSRRTFVGLAVATAAAVVLPTTLITAPQAHADVGETGLWGDQGDGTYVNPILPCDFSDPDVIRVGSDYYLVSSTFQFSGGVVVLHSSDLVSWETIGHVVDDVSVLGPNFDWDRMNNYGRGIYAPSIRYHDGMFWVYFPCYGGEGIFVGTATDPAGPWTVTQLKDRSGAALSTYHWSDPCPFWDEDGNAYLALSKPGGPYYTYLFRMTAEGTQILDGEITAMNVQGTAAAYPDHGTTVAPVFSTEGSKIFKRNGYYYLFQIVFQGSGAGPWMYRSVNLYGTKADGTPGGPGDPGTYETKFLGSTIPSQGAFVDTPDGDWYWVAQFNSGNYAGRRPHLLPVSWVDDWPMPGIDTNGDGVGEMVWRGDKPVTGQAVVLPQGSDEFTSAVLHPRWQWNYQPRSGYWSLTERPGWLRLKAYTPLTTGSFFRAGNTLGQRYVHGDWAEATTKVDISGMTDGHEAGMCLYDGGKSYCTLGVVQSGAVRTLRHNANGTVTDGPTLTATTLYLRTAVDKTGLSTFHYSLDGATFTQLGTAYQLTWGNYRGTSIGIYGYNNLTDTGRLDVDWFHYDYAGPTQPPTNPYATIQAETYSGQAGTQLENCSEGGKDVCFISNNDHTYYRNIDFGSSGAATFLARVASNTTGGTIEVRLDSPTGPLAGTATVTGTGGWQTYTTVTCPVTGVTGTRSLYLVYKGGSGNLFNVNWFRFGARPLARYAFDGDATDATGNGWTAALNGGVTFVAGKTGQAADLSGNSQYISLPTGIVSGLTDFTLATWVRLDTTAAWRRILDFGTGTTAYMYLVPTTGSVTRFAITTSGSGGEQRINSTTALPIGAWTHVAVTRNGTTGILHINGVVAGQNSAMTLSPSSLGSTTNNWLGRSQFSGDSYLDGQIDDFRIYARALTSTEILDMYQNP